MMPTWYASKSPLEDWGGPASLLWKFTFMVPGLEGASHGATG